MALKIPIENAGRKPFAWLIIISLLVGGMLGGIAIGYSIHPNSMIKYVDRWNNDTVSVDKWHNDTVYVDRWNNATVYADYTPFPPLVFTGIGNTVSAAFNLTAGSVRFNFTHTGGSSNFIIWLYTSAGAREELLVNEIGAYSGSKLIGVGNGFSYDAIPGRHYMDIQADGNWRVEITQLL